MKNYVQLKDGIVFAAHQSTSDVDDSGPNVWLVDEESSNKVGMKYDPNSKVFSEAPFIKYAILDEDNNNTVISIQKTIFASEVGNNPIITDNDVKILWTWDGTNFNPPGSATTHDVIFVNSFPITTSELIPAVTEEEIKSIQDAASKIKAQVEEVKRVNAEQAAQPIPQTPTE